MENKNCPWWPDESGHEKTPVGPEKERPILFSAPMVRAILAGTKTQTRRVVKPAHKAWMDQPVTHQLGEWDKRPLPYGKPGDRLWVREAFRFPESIDHLSPSEIGEKAITVGYPKPWCPIQFEADGLRRTPQEWRDFVTPPQSNEAGRLRPGMHMPRWASRITLEVTGVRVERLQDISEADAKEEGIEPLSPPPSPHEWSGPNRFTLRGMGSGACAGQVSWNAPTAIELYRRLWESINGPGSWDANPWVWVIEFRRIEA